MTGSVPRTDTAVAEAVALVGDLEMSVLARTVARNFSLLAVGELVNRLLTLAALTWLSRSLGLEGFGILSFGLALTAYGTYAGRAGLDLWGAREVARGCDVPALAGRLMIIRIPLAFAAVLLLFGFAIIQPNPAARQPLVTLAALVVVDVVNLAWVFLGRERMHWVVLGTGCNALVLATTVLLWVRQSSQTDLAAVLVVAGEVAGALLVLGVFVWRYGWPRMQLDQSWSRDIIRQSFPFAGVTILSTVRINADLVLIGVLLGAAPAGVYGAPFRLLLFLVAIVAAYFTSVQPALARYYLNNRERGQRLIHRSIQLVAIFTFPVAVGGTILANDLVALLFGPEFTSSAVVFQALVWTLVPVSLGTAYRYLFRAYNRQGLEMHALAWATAGNILLNLVMIPALGPLGAAAARLIGEVLLLILVWYWSRDLLSNMPPFALLLRPASAALVMAAVLVVLSPAPLIVSIIVAVLVYFPVLFVLGGLPLGLLHGVQAAGNTGSEV